MSDFTYQEGTALTWAQMNENLRLMQAKYLDSASSAAIAIAAANFKGNWSALTGALAVPASVYHSSKFWLLLSNLADVTAKVPGVDAEWLEIITGNVMGPASATAGNLATLDATGKVLSDSGVAPAALMPKAGGVFAGDVTVPSINGGQLAGLRNKIINGNFSINQRAVSGTVVLAAGAYGHDRWKAGASGCTYTFATSNNVTTLTISAGSLQQVIEGANLQSGTHTLSWSGTAQGKIGAGSYSATGVTGSATGGTNLTIEFNTGTLSLIRLEPGSTSTPFEFLPVGLELALCQRYYYRATAFLGYQGFAILSTQARFAIPFPVQMRINPTALEQSGTAANYVVTRNGGGTVTSNAVPTFIGAGLNAATVRLDFASGLTAGEGLQTQSAAGSFLGFSAEL